MNAHGEPPAVGAGICSFLRNNLSSWPATPDHRKPSSRAGPSPGRNVLQMETIHIMDISFSIRQHLMVYGGIAPLKSNDSKGCAMHTEKSDDRNLFITATSNIWMNQRLAER